MIRKSVLLLFGNSKIIINNSLLRIVKSTYFGIRILEAGPASYQECDLGQVM